MKKITRLASLINLLVVVSLLTSIVCSCFNTAGSQIQKQQTIVTKKSESSATSYIQLLSEVKEKEEENESSRNASYVPQIYLIAESLQLAFAGLPKDNIYDAPRSFGNATDIPLYLAKQTFLI
jgi:hypothetical protein